MASSSTSIKIKKWPLNGTPDKMTLSKDLNNFKFYHRIVLPKDADRMANSVDAVII